MRCKGAVALASVLSLLPATSQAQSTFRSASLEFVAGTPSGIAVGDFDGDGDLDAVTTNSNAGTISVLLGFADGTLSRIGDSFAGNVPTAVVAARFDADDDLDLLVANGNDNAVVLLRGGSGANFAAPAAPIAVGSVPTDFALGDCNGDGNTDVAVANEGDSESTPGSVSILIGGGDGTFAAGPTLTAGIGTRSVAAGDVDGDGLLDVLASNARDNTVSIFLGMGGCGFTAAPTISTGSAPHALALGDLDGDLMVDLVTAEANTDEVSVYLGNGDGTFQDRVSFSVGTAPTDLVVVRVDSDARLDVVAANNRSGDVSVLLGDGGGGLRVARSFVSDAQPVAIEIGEMNDDGLIDVIVANQVGLDGSVATLLNAGGGALAGVEDVPTDSAPTASAIGDIDDDGFPDLVVTHDGGSVLTFTSTGSGLDRHLQQSSRIELEGRPLGVAAVDLNGDERLDLAIVDNERRRVSVLLGAGSGEFGPPAHFQTDTQPSAIAVGDLNGDTFTDLAVTALGSPGRVSTLLGAGNGTFSAFRSTEVGDTPIALSAGRFDDDGCDDMAVVNEASDSVSILLSNCDGTLRLSQLLSNVGQGPVSIAAADYDRDGRLDLAVGNSVVPFGQASVRVFMGNGAGQFSPFAGGSIRAGDFIAAMAGRDLDGNFLPDLTAVNQTSNTVRVLSALGGGQFRSTNPVNVSRMPTTIAAADFDGDGRYDVATSNSDPSANNLSVLTNVQGEGALRGDANSDGTVSAADLIEVVLEVLDGDGQAVEDIRMSRSNTTPIGVDANGDGRVDGQDRIAVARRVFAGA